MTADKSPIIIFDSGIGGLTILREVRILLPERRFIYIADDAAFPYGPWKEDELLTHIVQLFDAYIQAHKPELVIIACHTASTLALTALRDAYPNVKFVGTVPAIKPAAERSYSGLISVLATPGTVKRDYTRDLIEIYAKNCHVRLVGSDHLARMAEAYMHGHEVDDADIWAQIDQCFIKKDDKRTDVVVLACTHYPFLANRFRQIAPWPVDWLNPAEAIARRALSLVEHDRQAIRTIGDDEVIFTSGHASLIQQQFMHGFGLKFGR